MTPTGIVDRAERTYVGFFVVLDRLTENWFLGSLARFIFLAVLFPFFWTSAMTKLGPGLGLTAGAYYQIAPSAMLAAGGQPSKLGFEVDLLVFLGTWAEVLLPVLIVLGLFTRLSSIAMILFVSVMTYVDVAELGMKPELEGALFDAQPDGMWDRRVLWGFLLVVLVVKGPGILSLDGLLGWLLYRRRERSFALPEEI